MAKKSTAQIPTLTKIDTMISCVYGLQMRDSGHVVVCKKKAVQCPRGYARALWHAKAPRGTIVHK